MVMKRAIRISALLGLVAFLIAVDASPQSTVAAQQSGAVTAQPSGTSAVQQQPAERGPTVRHPEATKAITRLKSPYCPGFMLEVCSSSAGAALRDTIEGLAEDGWSADSIISWVLANHGDTLLALPPAQGKGLVAWLVPPIVVAAGLSLVVVALRRMRREQPTVELGDDLTADQKNELETAMKELEEEEEAPLF
jgi:cytochrome c-type biogenesis protein CcmH/NrfF